MTNKELKIKAKLALTNKWGMAIGVLLVYNVLAAAASQISFIGLILVSYPMLYGYTKFNMAVKNGFGEFELVFDGFRESFLDNSVTILLRDLFVLLWTLLLIVPGIIKSISYALVPYILVDSDYDNLFNTEALKKSEKMMYGHKKRYFCLALSFIGWHILGLFTLGILNILYVLPYQYQTMTQFYYEIKALDREQVKIERIANDSVKEFENNENDWDF
jgi:uncharacterized membrane protein